MEQLIEYLEELAMRQNSAWQIFHTGNDLRDWFLDLMLVWFVFCATIWIAFKALDVGLNHQQYWRGVKPTVQIVLAGFAIVFMNAVGTPFWGQCLIFVALMFLRTQDRRIDDLERQLAEKEQDT